MPRVRIAARAEVPPGVVRPFTAGDTPVALCNVGGRFHAVHGECPHRNAPLGEGALHHTSLVCPWHAWEFDCTTGCYDLDPGIRLDTYPVTLDGDDVFVDVPL